VYVLFTIVIFCMYQNKLLSLLVVVVWTYLHVIIFALPDQQSTLLISKL